MTNQAKVSRREQRRQEVEARRRRRTLTFLLPVVAVVVIFGGLLLYQNLGGDIEGVVEFGRQEQSHDEGVEIAEADLPPVGGVHSPRWQNCGIYDQPVEKKYAIHAMEHGAVWITYQPELPAGQIESLRELARGQTFMLLSPYPGLRSPVVATAWGLQLELDSAEEPRLAEFTDAYRLGPQTPEFGAPCTGGIGQPLG
ncbi:MAG: DUF3105 domain-containing protein [Candidatus Promineifilaceae bacterium]